MEQRFNTSDSSIDLLPLREFIERERLRIGERNSGIPRPRMSAKVFPLLMYYALQCSLGFTELAGRLARLFLEETAEGLLLVESQ